MGEQHDIPRTPLPMRPIIAILLLQFSNSVIMTLPFPFLPFLVRVCRASTMLATLA